jgi:4-hydroxy-3-polyprenylbenzoate decarboxylase
MTAILKQIPKKRLVIGISGASGAALAVDLLHCLREFPDWETHLVISSSAETTLRLETAEELGEVMKLATYCHSIKNIGASIASGTFKTEGMIVVPCSMKTLSGIATGYSDNLLLRAADVTIKERRPLVLVARESPLSTIHLRNMLTLSELGAIIMPPMITHYNKPMSMADLTRHITGKILDKFGIEANGFRRWGEIEV